MVIAIIALLVSILLPSLQQAKNMAKGVICKTNMRGIYTALTLYTEDNRGWIMGVSSSFALGGGSSQWTPWNAILAKYPQQVYELDSGFPTGTPCWEPAVSYVDSTELFECPMDDRERAGSFWHSIIGSYGLNIRVGYGAWNPNTGPWNMQGATRAENVYLFGESPSYTIYWRESDPEPFFAFRHGDGYADGHMMFADGHQESLNWDTLYVETYNPSDWIVAWPWFNGKRWSETLGAEMPKP